MARARPRKRTTVTKAKTNWPVYNLRFDIDELRKNLRINKHALDEEVEVQPELYGEIADAAALAKSNVESLEEQLKELEADLDKQIREDADNDEERITENQIKSRVASSQERKNLAVKLLEARNSQRRLEALQTAQRHKSYAIRDMVDLYLSNYYGSHSMKGAKGDYSDAEAERIENKMGERRSERASKRVKRHRNRV